MTISLDAVVLDCPDVAVISGIRSVLSLRMHERRIAAVRLSIMIFDVKHGIIKV